MELEVYSRRNIRIGREKVKFDIIDHIRACYREELMNNQILVCPVMNGAMCLCVDLMRDLAELGYNLPVASVFADSYSKEDNSHSDDLALYVPLSVDRKVIFLLDDIWESGRTMEALTQYMLDKGAKAVVRTVLINRSKTDMQPDIWGLRLEEDFWLAGYGLDDTGKKRFLQNIVADFRSKND